MKKYYFSLTIILLILLIYTRISTRLTNVLWTDEIELMNNLKSFNYLIYEYLPRIPGGSPGYYLMILPLKFFFGGNPFILGIPGFVSHIVVFLLIPKIVSILVNESETQRVFTTIFARIGFVFDPSLSFQAMEIRPYAVLPLLWVLCFLLTHALVNSDNKIIKDDKDVFKMASLSMCYFLLFIWHYYGFIITSTIYIYFIFNKKVSLDAFKIHIRSFILLTFTSIISIPFWKHFVSAYSFHRFNTFEWFNWDILKIYLLNQGTMQRTIPQHVLYISFLVITLFGMGIMIMKLMRNRHTREAITIIRKSVKMLVFLVAFPSIVILAMDMINTYWFLLRQISWTLVPFYIVIGILGNLSFKLFFTVKK